MNLSDLDYELPPELIAQTPLEDRSSSRMILVSRDSERIEHRRFIDFVDLLDPGDLVVMNDTRVDAVRLQATKVTGAKVELLVLKHLEGNRYEALLKPGKRAKKGTRLLIESDIYAVVSDDAGDLVRVIEFEGSDVENQLRRIGETPLPPYIHRPILTPERYQTVYAREGGSAAAPTAGLHFTPEVLGQMKERGIETARVTLNVSIDTFRPVSVDDTDDHVMHGETCEVSQAAADAINRCDGRVVAIGTTTARTLESFAVAKRCIEPGRMHTKIFIGPGYEWKIVNALLTNFHLPRTTMLAMIASLASPAIIRGAYAEAVAQKYRFLSFGDCMFIL